ncbi:MAG: hypothetical protein KJ847_01905 [Firmicutes bacterium]|nr:hypothetical protein [Bacillota bacterium]
MNYLLSLAIFFIIMIWYIRPLYNFFAIRKYSLHDDGGNIVWNNFKSALPSILFYTLLLALFFYPVITNELISSVQSSSIFIAEVVFLFVLTRIDKGQTKYEVSSLGVKHHWKFIKWSSKKSIKFKKSAFFVLHKPRFIIKDEKQKIVIPILSKNIELFLKTFMKHDQEQGARAMQIYKNTISYYLNNTSIEKELNKHGKS